MSLTTLSPNSSSWIRAIGYQKGYLAIFADDFAWLVAGVPPTLPGLIVAGRVTAKEDGELSIGAAVHRLVLETGKKEEERKFVRQKVSGEFELRQLWRLMDI